MTHWQSTRRQGYRSRLGNRELAHRDRIKPILKSALLRGVTDSEAAAMANQLARYFHVEPAASPAATPARVLDVALGM